MRKVITNRKKLAGLALVWLLAMCQCLQVSAQSRVVKGSVTDAQGEPLIGVTVLIKGTSQGVSTGASGRFQINLTSSQQTLVFSLLGYETKEVNAGTGADVNVVLKETVSNLNEVVVIGYGTAKRSDLTGSVGSVKMTDLQKAPVKSFDEALAGRVAGVQVTSSEGQPGASIDVVVRGYNSVTQNNAPLYVIDGFPMEDPNNSVVNPLNTIDPNDIESIDILKDASATAIYGARGANGVVMITTKKGKLGAPVITYNGYYGFQNSNKRMDVLSPYEYVKLQYEIDSTKTKSFYLQNGQLSLDSYKNVDGINWEDEITRTAPMQNHYLSLAGGTTKTKYSVSLSHLGQDGIIMSSGYNRTQGRASLDQEVSKRLKVGFNTAYSAMKMYGQPTSTSNFSNTINLLYSAWAYRPVAVSSSDNLLNEGLDPEATDYRYNPILTTQNELRETYTNSFNANGYAVYDITNDLSLKIQGGVNRGLREYDVFNGSQSRSAISGNYGVAGGKTFYNSTNWQNTNTLTYTKTINKRHKITALGGLTLESGKSSVYGGYSTGLPNEGLGLDGADEGTPFSITSYSSESTMVSFLGRVNYTLDDKYLFTVSMRADGSSRFRDDNQWGYFPSGAFAWQLGKEDFMKNLAFISNAKLRLSYGVTGNNQIGNYATYPGIGISGSSGYIFSDGYVSGAYLSSLGNAGLKWESTGQADIGLNLGFLKDRISLEVDAYRKKTYDLLLNAQLSPSTGYPNATKNIGKVQNQGLEFTLSTVPVNGKFRWTSDFNISFNRNKVLELAENQRYMLSSQYWGDDWKTIYPYIAELNQPIAQFYGLIWDGVYTYDDFDKIGNTYQLKANVTTNGTTNPKPGDVKYKDLNGDRQINEADKVIIGQPYPKYVGGWSNNFSYKGFDLGVFLQWSYGNDIINANRIMLETGSTYNTNQFASYANRWSPTNQNSTIPAAKGSIYKAYSTRFIEDGSFLRLKTVSLGYNLPKTLLDNVKVKAVRVYVTAQNLYTWTNYSGYDPEVSVRNSALTPGFDYSAYPRARTLVFGLNASF
ncbi:TonB-dependent receptor [Pedobacter sp. BS3]|uniref:SusC/RagA family TonB-linked outer membrane protein n=1 Tax=Pedobacter sp. BS3 TaxID=2567937 RepID=UPI0011EC160C|nr:TonB-dependent receptor [Pedobacter sp. BS3]TZF81830.1 TonB-dependent receptor [Pedobacter sp. BS3]